MTEILRYAVHGQLYLECHVTIEPVFGERLDKVTELAHACGFRVADLLMQKRAEDTPERSKHDTFMTARSKNLYELRGRMKYLVDSLRMHNFKVWRYKIEDTIVDSKISDAYGLLAVADRQVYPENTLPESSLPNYPS